MRENLCDLKFNRDFLNSTHKFYKLHEFIKIFKTNSFKQTHKKGTTQANRKCFKSTYLIDNFIQILNLQMANKCLKRWSTLLIIRVIKIKQQ